MDQDWTLKVWKFPRNVRHFYQSSRGHGQRASFVDLDNVDVVAKKLGVHSVRKVEQIVQSFRNSLTEEEKLCLKDWLNGAESPSGTDPFPSLGVKPRITDEDSMLFWLFKSDTSLTVFSHVRGKTLYTICVKMLNKDKLKIRADTPWRSHLKVEDEQRPVWKAL